MKKVIALILIIITLLSSSACGKQKNNDMKSTNNASYETASNSSDSKENEKTSANNIASGDVVNITEKMYVTYINEIYTNTKDYVGKTIKLEGMFSTEYYEQTRKTYYYVYRTGPGCCGNDGSMCGFEFTYKGEMPKENDWIEVVGKLRTYEEEGNTYLTLDSTSLKVLDKRGAETVYR